jgi:hypothetical protein
MDLSRFESASIEFIDWGGGDGKLLFVYSDICSGCLCCEGRRGERTMSPYRMTMDCDYVHVYFVNDGNCIFYRVS